MITIGFWCDECRQKYVRHMCKNRTLPCGHSYEASFAVECQAFARSGEHVYIEWRTFAQPSRADVWITRSQERDVHYCGDSARKFWGMMVRPFGHEDDWEFAVGEWLASKPDGFVRAFLNRWNSTKFVPDWIAFREHPYAKRACAVMVVR